MNKIASILEVAPIRVYEVATFYTMFNRQPVGKYHVLVCGTTPCMLRGSREIEAALEAHWGIKKGETTACGSFTLGEMECMGSCVNAPMLVVADYTGGVANFTYNYYEDLTPASAVALMDELKAKGTGGLKKVGSLIRDKAEPAGGQTTLLSAPPGPYCRECVRARAIGGSLTRSAGSSLTRRRRRRRRRLARRPSEGCHTCEPCESDQPNNEQSDRIYIWTDRWTKQATRVGHFFSVLVALSL